MIVSSWVGSESKVDFFIRKEGCTLIMKDESNNSIFMSFKNYRHALGFVQDLEEKLNDEYAEQFELLHDEY